MKREIFFVIPLILFAIPTNGAEVTSIPLPKESQIILMLPFKSEHYDSRLVVLGDNAKESVPRFFVLPVFLQKQAVEVSGPSSSPVRFTVTVEATLTEKLRYIIRSVSQDGKIESPIFEFVTISIPKLGFVQTFRGTSLPPFQDGTRLTFTMDVDKEQLPIAYDLLERKELQMDLIFRFGPETTGQVTFRTSRDQFLSKIGKSQNVSASNSEAIFSYAEIDDQLTLLKHGTNEINLWRELQLVLETQVTTAEVLNEWFEEVPGQSSSERFKGTIPGSSDPTEKGSTVTADDERSAVKGFDPFQGLPRRSNNLLFRIKAQPAKESLEIIRAKYLRPVGEIRQAIQIGFKPAPIPQELDWRPVTEKQQVNLDFPAKCRESGKFVLPIKVKRYQLVKFLLVLGDIKKLQNAIRMDVSGETTRLSWSIVDKENEPKYVSQVVVKDQGTPIISLEENVCKTLPGNVSLLVSVYE